MRQKKILSSTCQLISNLNTFLDVKESIHLLKEKLENKYIQQGEMCQQLMTIWDQLSGLKLYSFFDYDKNNRDVFSQFEKRLSELSPALPLKKIKDAFEDELKVSFEKAKAQLNRCSDEEKKVLSRELLDAVNLKSLEKRVNERLQKYKRNVLRLLTVSDLKTPKDRQADPMFPDVAYLAELKQNFSLIDREMPAIAPSLRQLLEFITVEDKSIVLSESARYFAFSEHEDKIGHQKQLLKDEGMQILLDELQPLIDLSEKNKLVRAKHFRIQGNEDAIQKEVFLTLLIFGHYIKIDSFLSELASKSRSFGFEEETSRFFKDAQDRYAVLFQSNVKKLLFWSIYQDKQQSIVEKKECVARVKFEKETIKEAQRQLKDIVVQYEEAEFLCSFQKRHAFNNACSLYAKHMKDLQGKIVSYSEKMESNKTDPFLLHLSKFTFLLNKMKPDYEDQIQSKKIVFNRETIQKLERRYKITQDRLSDLPDSELQGLCQFFNELTYDTLSRHRQIGSESKHEHVAFLKSLKSNETRYPFYFDTIELDYLILLLSLRVSVGDCRANKKKLNIQSINDFFENNVNLLIQFPRNKYIINKFIEIATILDKEYWIDFLNVINQSNEFKKQDFKEKLFTLSEKTNDKKLKKIIYEYIKI